MISPVTGEGCPKINEDFRNFLVLLVHGRFCYVEHQETLVEMTDACVDPVSISNIST